MLNAVLFHGKSNAAEPTSKAALPPVFHPTAVTLYRPDTVIYAQGDEAGALYYVEFGAVRISRLTADGRRQISAFHFAGEVFGFEAPGEHHFYAEAIETTGVRMLRPGADGDAKVRLLPLVLAGMTRAQEHLLVLGRQDARQRVVAFLLDLAERQDADCIVQLPMKRADIADYLGLTFETVSRVLARLKASRLIRVPNTKQIEILDFGRLEDICE